jgi:rhamnogalacturonan endolyase
MQHIRLFSDDFAGFALGPFPYDPEHSAMGEYHFYPETGYKGQWFDPIADFDYKGPSWLVTSPAMDGRHIMEQMRITCPAEKKAVPVLRAGDTDWTDVTVSVNLRVLMPSRICGFLFRYQTSMMHYGIFLADGCIELHRVVKQERTILARKEITWDCDTFHELSVTVTGSRIQGFLDGKQCLEADDTTYSNGCIALCACMPTQYVSVSVTTDEKTAAALEQERSAGDRRVAELRSIHAKPKLFRTIDLKNFGAGRQIRFGHLTGTDELFFVMCQHQRRIYKDRYPFISCMTAVSIETGRILWQIGEPRDDDDVINLTTDLPFQIYDIDGDGYDEVICSWDFTLMILDGKTGSIKKSIPTPRNEEPPESVCSLEFGKYASARLNVDAIRIVNVRGLSRPSDILIKDRYSRIWIYTGELKFLWKFSQYNTGHFPYGYDFNGDGKDEIFSCYNMINSGGTLEWALPIHQDHTDEIIVGKFDPDRDDEIIAIVSGWEGFMLVDKQGHILVRDINGHGQRISTGNYCPERKGFEICTTTYWGNNGIIYLYDCRGQELWHREMLCNGNVIAPVNWDGNGTELIFLNGDPVQGGLADGDGNIVVQFPSDGHPSLCAEVLNVTGDARDEIVLWDRHKLYIYTQDVECPVVQEKGEYVPYKYPIYNASNYRGEFSFPRWIRR